MNGYNIKDEVTGRKYRWEEKEVRGEPCMVRVFERGMSNNGVLLAKDTMFTRTIITSVKDIADNTTHQYNKQKGKQV